jgi:hypothetical protein
LTLDAGSYVVTGIASLYGVPVVTGMMWLDLGGVHVTPQVRSDWTSQIDSLTVTAAVTIPARTTVGLYCGGTGEGAVVSGRDAFLTAIKVGAVTTQ